MTVSAAQRIHTATLRDAGGTFNGRTGRSVDVSAGYVVARDFGSFGILDRGEFRTLRDFGRMLRALRRRHPGALVGTWLNDGAIHVDAVDIIADRETAIRLGRERRQLAIWNGIASAEVTL